MNQAANNQKLSDYLTLVAVQLNFIKTQLLNSIDNIYYYHALNERMLKMADDITTAPEKLAELAKSEKTIIRRKIASNPNTPTEVLLELGCEFPEEMLNNAVFSLLVLENPNLIRELSEATLQNMLDKNLIPLDWWDKLVNHRFYDEIILVSHPNTPIPVLKNIYFDKIERNTYYFVYGTKALVSGIAKNRNTPITILKRMIQNEEQEYGYSTVARKAIAQNPQAPIDILRRLSRVDCDEEVRALVANHPNTPSDALTWLAGDTHKLVQYAVAKNLNTPSNVLERLAKSHHHDVRVQVAQRSDAPADVLEILSKNHHPEIRRLLATNPNTPTDILKLLAHAGYKKEVALNPNAPFSRQKKSLEDEDFALRCLLASNPHTPASTLEELALDNDKSLRFLVALNPNTPVTVLKLFAQDEDKLFRRAVANNPNTPAEIRKLAQN